ncbi:MAG: DinB family protein [Acidobacteriota bacterium]|nr:DinB family protein [Acidobacteriota bacterium]
MNAYRNRLLGLVAGEDVYAILEDTPQRVSDLFSGIGDAGLSRRFGPGKWTAREVFCHLADVEVGTGFRIRQIATSTGQHIIQPFDQDLWAKPYARLPARAAVTAFSALRPYNLAWYRTLPAEDLSRVAFHPERGDESIETIIRMQAGHDRNHLAQLESIAAASEKGGAASEKG